MSELSTRFEALKAQAAQLGYRETLDFKNDRSEAITAVCWGMESGAPTARVLLAVLPDDALADTAADDVLQLAWQAPVPAAATRPPSTPKPTNLATIGL